MMLERPNPEEDLQHYKFIVSLWYLSFLLFGVHYFKEFVYSPFGGIPESSVLYSLQWIEFIVLVTLPIVSIYEFLKKRPSGWYLMAISSISFTFHFLNYFGFYIVHWKVLHTPGASIQFWMFFDHAKVLWLFPVLTTVFLSLITRSSILTIFEVPKKKSVKFILVSILGCLTLSGTHIMMFIMNP